MASSDPVLAPKKDSAAGSVPKLPLEKEKARNALAATISRIIPEIRRITGRAATPPEYRTPNSQFPIPNLFRKL
jgi:hypothetical protein